MRSRILDLTYTEWKESGFSKGTLHELKKKARSEEPFNVYGKVKERIAACSSS
jgi:CRISPR-associated protein Cas1